MELDRLRRRAVWEAAAHDKKVAGGRIWMALPRRVGRVELVPLEMEELARLVGN